VYLLLDLRRRRLFVRDLVWRMEQALIDTLAHYQIPAQRKDGAPGVYVPRGETLAKIAALGIKVRNQCTYHGLALNIDMDLAPFLDINPCGYAGMETIDMRSLGQTVSFTEVQTTLLNQLAQYLQAAAHSAPHEEGVK
jgi:lipoyl(octanoyl) transferase